MRRSLIVLACAGSVAFAPVAQATSLAAQADDWDRANAEIDRFGRENPSDLAGLERLAVKYTGQRTKVTLNGVAGELTGEQAQRILDSRVAAWKSDGTRGAVPVDAFSVAVQFVPVLGPPKRVKVRGTWDFRDDYVNGSAPDDFASVPLKLAPCQRILDTSSQTYNYRNEPTGASYLKDAGLGSAAPIIGIRDNVAGFVTNFDHGFAEVLVQSDCSGPKVGAAFSYEHNQDGNGGASVSASWGGMSVSYANATPALQKSANPIYQ